jgi:hypothetical protein
MQHHIQPSDQHSALKKLVIASESDVMVGIEMQDDRQLFGNLVTMTLDWKP